MSKKKGRQKILHRRLVSAPPETPPPPPPPPGVDLCGPLPTSNNFKFCLTTQDCFTKLITLTPLRNKTAEHVTHALIRVFLRHGFYPVLRCDNGGEFISDLQQQLDRLLGTVRLRTHPYTPRQNPVERSHRTINSMIAKTVTVIETGATF
jgi:hypothetical protein